MFQQSTGVPVMRVFLGESRDTHNRRKKDDDTEQKEEQEAIERIDWVYSKQLVDFI